MKKMLFGLFVLLFSGLGILGKLFADSPDVEDARRYGAQGCVTLRVVDSFGKPVSHAKLSIVFYPSDSYANVRVSEGETDTNGLYRAEGKTVGDVTYTVTRTNYYNTRDRYWFYRRGEECVRNNRWLPWNPTNTVVFKEKRNPIPMYAKRVDAVIPVRDAPVGFDLEVGDWVVPHGSGKNADICFTYHSDFKDFWTGKRELLIACTNRMDGFYRAQKDLWSDFHSAYEAPIDGYQPGLNLILEGTKEKILKSEQISELEYLMFRVRTVTDDAGEVISARYGKIYGRLEYGAGVNLDRLRFTYYFNPTPNDRNLEFDPSRNLFPESESTRVNIP